MYNDNSWRVEEQEKFFSPFHSFILYLLLMPDNQQSENKEQETKNQPPPQDKQREETSADSRPRPPEPEKELFTWKAPARPFKRRDRKFWTTVIAIATLFGVILFLVEGAMPVILIISIIFLYYVLSTVEPEVINYSITTWGVKVEDKRTEWDLITRYWFVEKLGSDVLVFETMVLPGRLELVVNKKDKEEIKKVLNKYVLYEEAPPSNLDKAANWFSKKLPS